MITFTSVTDVCVRYHELTASSRRLLVWQFYCYM